MTALGDDSRTHAFISAADVAPVITEPGDVGGVYDRVFTVGADAPYSDNHPAEAVAGGRAP